MPRRREVPKRHIIPDPKYKDKLVSKFTNTLMFNGGQNCRAHENLATRVQLSVSMIHLRRQTSSFRPQSH